MPPKNTTGSNTGGKSTGKSAGQSIGRPGSQAPSPSIVHRPATPASQNSPSSAGSTPKGAGHSSTDNIGYAKHRTTHDKDKTHPKDPFRHDVFEFLFEFIRDDDREVAKQGKPDKNVDTTKLYTFDHHAETINTCFLLTLPSEIYTGEHVAKEIQKYWRDYQRVTKQEDTRGSAHLAIPRPGPLDEADRVILKKLILDHDNDEWFTGADQLTYTSLSDMFCSKTLQPRARFDGGVIVAEITKDLSYYKRERPKVGAHGEVHPDDPIPDHINPSELDNAKLESSESQGESSYERQNRLYFWRTRFQKYSNMALTRAYHELYKSHCGNPPKKCSKEHALEISEKLQTLKESRKWPTDIDFNHIIIEERVLNMLKQKKTGSS